MLSETEQEGCRRLLNKLSTSEVISLANTVTKRQIQITGEMEAIKAILTYTESPVELMRRKKMKRDTLFQYLVEVGVVVSVSAEKRELMQKILKHWGADAVDFTDMDVDTSDENLVATPSRHTATVSNSAQTVDRQYSPAGVQTDAQTLQSEDSLTHTRSLVAQTLNPTDHATQQQYQSRIIPNQTTGDLNTASKTDSSFQPLGEQFAKWFFEMLNSFNPAVPGSPKEFGPQHFWDDAKLKVNVVNPSPSQEEYIGPQMVADRLISLTKEEQLLFNPNISTEGVFVKSSRHGLVMIIVCGTIHRGNDCLGVFQQIFGIIKDPRYNDNWKIKVTYLDVQSSKVTAMPKLEGNVDNFLNSLIPV